MPVCVSISSSLAQSVPQWFYKLYWVQTVEGVGDADTLNGREWEWRQDRSSLHHSSPEKSGGVEDSDMDVKGGRERGRYCVGRGVRENEREWAATQHSHQLPSIHHLPQPKGCHCFISISSFYITCVCVRARSLSQAGLWIFVWESVHKIECVDVYCVYVCLIGLLFFVYILQFQFSTN